MKKLIVLSSCLLLLFTACEPPEYPTIISGTLYTDSTLSTPVANDTVWFCNIDKEYLGHATTDSLGRFGFLFWNFDVTKTEYEWRKNFYYNFNFIALYGQDTLLRGRYRDEYQRLILFPGRCWKITL